MPIRELCDFSLGQVQPTGIEVTRQHCWLAWGKVKCSGDQNAPRLSNGPLQQVSGCRGASVFGAGSGSILYSKIFGLFSVTLP